MLDPKQLLRTITWGNLHFDDTDSAPPKDEQLSEQSIFLGAYFRWRSIIDFIKMKCPVMPDRIPDLNIHEMKFLAVDESAELFSFTDLTKENRDGFLWIPKEAWTEIQYISKEDAELIPECPDWIPGQVWKEVKENG